MGRGRNAIIISVVILAFIVGTLTANPIVEAASPMVELLTDPIFGLEEIKKAVDDFQVVEPLSQIITQDIHTTGVPPVFEATSDKQFIVEACGVALHPISHILVYRGDVELENLIGAHHIGNVEFPFPPGGSALAGDCTTIGGNPNDKISLKYDWPTTGAGGIIAGTITLRTTPSAEASIAPLPP